MAGRILSMPLAFLVPVVIVRFFTVGEFGVYKQLFLLFNIVLPIIDIGISQSLLYFLPKYTERSNEFISQTIVLQLPIFILLLCGSFGFSTEIGQAVGGEDSVLGAYVSYVIVFAMLWHMSNILEGYLIVKGLSLQAGIITFLSETVRSLVTIAIVFAGGGLLALMTGFVLIGVIRLILMGTYFHKISNFKFTSGHGLIYEQLAYSVPFGVAVIINTLVIYSHQYIVSYFSSLSDFAMYSVGCFSLPFLTVMAGSASKISLVKMSDIVARNDQIELVAEILQNSIRKLWLIFFPVFVWLYVIAEDFIEILYTDAYLEAVPVFRIFILMVPLSAFLVQHVPRAFGKTAFILYANCISLLVSIVACFFLLKLYGLVGAAGGFVLSNVLWRVMFVLKCKHLIGVSVKKMIPLAIIIKTGSSICIIGFLVYCVNAITDFGVYYNCIFTTLIFFLMCSAMYWRFGVLLDVERKYIVIKIQHVADRVRGIL